MADPRRARPFFLRGSVAAVLAVLLFSAWLAHLVWHSTSQAGSFHIAHPDPREESERQRILRELHDELAALRVADLHLQHRATRPHLPAGLAADNPARKATTSALLQTPGVHELLQQMAQASLAAAGKPYETPQLQRSAVIMALQAAYLGLTQEGRDIVFPPKLTPLFDQLATATLTLASQPFANAQRRSAVLVSRFVTLLGEPGLAGIAAMVRANTAASTASRAAVTASIAAAAVAAAVADPALTNNPLTLPSSNDNNPSTGAKGVVSLPVVNNVVVPVDASGAGGARPQVSAAEVVPVHLDLALALASVGPVGSIVNVVFSNHAYVDFVLNWVAHCQRLHMRYMVAAFDQALLQVCLDRGLPVVFVDAKLGTGFVRGNSEGKMEFLNLGAVKGSLVLDILTLGYHVVLSDSDVVWFMDPAPFFSSAPWTMVDVAVSTDCTSPESEARTLAVSPGEVARNPFWFRSVTPQATQEHGNIIDAAFNTGVAFYRSTEPAKAFVKEWTEVMQSGGKSINEFVWDDQQAFNTLTRISMLPVQMVSGGQLRVLRAHRGNMNLGILPMLQFCSGHVYFAQRTSLTPYMVHNTFQFHASAGKVARFREDGIWLVDDDSYYTQGKFLQLSSTLPPELEKATPGVVTQARIGAYYQMAVRNGIALARQLNRTLIMPRLRCYCDRYWYAVVFDTCSVPGTRIPLPFPCPVDYMFHLEHWTKHRVPWRVHSFLDNPRVPEWLRQDIGYLRVQPPHHLPEEGAPDKAPRVEVPAGAYGEQVLEALATFVDKHVIHIESPAVALCRFHDEAKNAELDKFIAEAELFSDVWCCTKKLDEPNIVYKPPPRFKNSAPCTNDFTGFISNHFMKEPPIPQGP